LANTPKSPQYSRYTQEIVEIIDDLTEAIAIYDPQDRLIFFNRAFLKINPKAEEFVAKGLTYEDGLRMNVELGKVLEAKGREEEFIRQRVHAHQNPTSAITVRDYADGRRLLIKEAKTGNGGIVLCITVATDLRKTEEKLRDREKELVAARKAAEVALRENTCLTLALAEKVKQLEILATQDSLTKLFNRSKIDEVLSQEVRRSSRYEHGFGVILLDIDHFKQINDRHGHQTGDRVLVEFGRILADCCRATDMVGRWGGEEFLIICPETNAEGLAVLAENLRKAVETHEFPDVGPQTASFGIASIRAGEDAMALISRADSALYRAKESGRNKVIVSN